ncbi:MAG: phosphomannomutase/phosphoglucomutase [Methylococcales bacterium]
MNRIFSILSAVTIMMTLVAGGGMYWVSLSDIKEAQQQATKALSQGLALSISAQVNALQATVSKMATSAELIEAADMGNPRQRAEVAKRLEQFIPSALKIRILPTNVTELDESSIPHMGNADLIMVQETLSKKQLAVIQGRGENRHLAITAAIIKDNVPVGVILASLKFNFLQSILNSAHLNNSLIELKQQKASLAKTSGVTADTPLDKQIKIPNTSWSLYYAPKNTSSIFSISVIASIIFVPALIIGLSFFIAYRNITHLLRQDLGTILKAIKDLFSGKTIGSYPVHFNEMKTLISTMVQFKRVLDHGGTDFPSELVPERGSDDFFDEPEGVSFLEMDDDMLSGGKSIPMPSSPIALPEIAPVDFPDISVVTSATDPEPEIKPKEKPTINASIYRAYDIRGIAEKTLTTDIVFNIGKAIASEVKEKNINSIVIGRDGRLSSESFAEILAKGIISTGVNVLDIGLVPSPLVYFVAQHTEGKSAVVVTASHNPAEYNGLKIIIDGETLAGDRIQQIKQRVDQKNYAVGNPGSIDKNNMFINEYIGTIAEDTHLVRPMKVVVDCGNGATGEIAPTLLKTLGCEVFELFCDIDGTFPNHHPDPTNPANLQNLIAGVEHYEADIGIAFDGDGDRIGVIDSKGKIIWPDRLLMLFAKEVLSHKPGTEIIYDIKSTHHLKGYIAKQGGRSLMCKTGHSFIKAKLKETGAALAGEMSGHIFFNDRWFGFDDALYSAARLIGILSADTRDSAQVFADIPESFCTPEIYIELAEGENINLMQQLLAKVDFKDAEIITFDGLRADFSDGWGLVRASNTMPALALRFEADTAEALNRIQSQFKDLLTQTKADINVPF